MSPMPSETIGGTIGWLIRIYSKRTCQLILCPRAGATQNLHGVCHHAATKLIVFRLISVVNAKAEHRASGTTQIYSLRP